MNENRITGPGYYPRRPTTTKSGHYFGVVPGHLCLQLYGGTSYMGDLRWRGSGTYSFALRYVHSLRLETATHWVLANGEGFGLRIDLPEPVVMTAGKRISVELHSLTPPVTTEPVDSWLVWGFEPARKL